MGHREEIVHEAGVQAEIRMTVGSTAAAGAGAKACLKAQLILASQGEKVLRLRFGLMETAQDTAIVCCAKERAFDRQA